MAKTTQPPRSKPAAVVKPARKRPAKPARPLGPVINSTVNRVRAACNEIVARYVCGESFETIAQGMSPPLSGMQVRFCLENDAEMAPRLHAGLDYRAHHFMDRAASMAGALEDAGMAKEAMDGYLKLAAKQAPRLYGDKATIALTGANGGPVESVIKLTPSEAYKMALGRA